ncbi:SDR family oxidoreductase [Nocardia mikamii]|uniref:SDR family oxidoreductase n=1 Tax=Nocardia mikamii TaxID=508464 RepID=UPI001431F982|nr:SDR family oxidoreductase [Nocardia mikamii]
MNRPRTGTKPSAPSTVLSPPSARPVLVTGASGRIGSGVVAALLSAGAPVRAAYRDPARTAAMTESGHDAVTVDYRRPATLPAAMAGVGTLFLVTATTATQTQDELTLVDAACEAGVERVVKVSLWRADERLTPLADLHRPVEQAIERSGLRWTFLRPNFFMQNFAQMAASIAEHGVIARPGGSAPISYVDARDVAGVAAHVLTTGGHDGRVYSLTGPRALTYEQVADVFSDVLRNPVRYRAQTATQAREGLLAAGVPAFMAAALVRVSVVYGEGGADSVLSTVTDLTGDAPRTFEQFVRGHRRLFG